MTGSIGVLTHAQYGKDNVRVCKVQRNPDGTQDMTEMTVCTQLEGEGLATSWTHADNAKVVATDTQKQTIYLMAKLHPVNPPERFAATLADHFLQEYPWVDAAHATVTVNIWRRFDVDGKPHPHSFIQESNETRVALAVARRNQGITITSGINGLLLFKSTGSQFWGFHRDKYTRLPETWDRILSTEVETRWKWRRFTDLKEVISEESVFDSAWQETRTITLNAFAKEDSPSVQNTMFIMSERILAAVPRVDSVDYSLPNKHYFEIDLSWFEGLKNTGKDAEVYAPQTDPNGLIQCTVARSSTPPKL